MIAETNSNKRAYDDLIHAIRNRSTIGLIGAGSSMQAGFPSLNQLLELMADQAEVPFKLHPERDPLMVAEDLYHRLEVGDKFASFIRRTFSTPPKGIQDIHLNLTKIPFAHILTTNYDKILELAHLKTHPGEELNTIICTDKDGLNELCDTLKNPNAQRHYAYLHGRYNQPQTIVLTESQYQKRYSKNSEQWKNLFATAATRHIVSIGFSHRDPALQAIFREAKTSTGGVPHFALLPCPQELSPEEIRNALRKKMGIEPIFYEHRKEDPHHNNLTLTLEDILRRTTTQHNHKPT